MNIISKKLMIIALAGAIAVGMVQPVQANVMTALAQSMQADPLGALAVVSSVITSTFGIRYIKNWLSYRVDLAMVRTVGSGTSFISGWVKSAFKCDASECSKQMKTAGERFIGTGIATAGILLLREQVKKPAEPTTAESTTKEPDKAAVKSNL